MTERVLWDSTGEMEVLPDVGRRVVFRQRRRLRAAHAVIATGTGTGDLVLWSTASTDAILWNTT